MTDLTAFLDAFDAMFADMHVNNHGSRMSYIGCKQKYLPELESFLPDWDTLTEPFGGMGAVTRRYLIECEAEFHKRVVWADAYEPNRNLFECIRDNPDEMVRRLAAVVNDEGAYRHYVIHREGKYLDNIGRAVGYLVSLNSASHAHQSLAHRSGFEAKKRITELPGYLPIYSRLLRHLTIETDAFEVITKYDAKGTLHFIDPPYIIANRKHKSTRYNCELTDEQQHQLCRMVLECKGRVCLCGYPSELYDGYFSSNKKWRVVGPLNKRTSKTYWQPELCWVNFSVPDDVVESLKSNGRKR